MGTFGGSLWGAGSSSSSGSVGVQLSTLIDPMLRIAGITILPGTTPSVDQRGELIGMVNRMLDSYSLDGAKIFTSSIDSYALTSGLKTYTIGPSGDFNTDRPPLYIKAANILFPTSPVVRRRIEVLDDDQWASVAIQDITGAPPFQLYFDNGLNASGLSNIYLRFQPPAGYTLELSTWKALQSSFTAVTDVALFPPGYEEVIVWNGALRVAAMYPLEAKLSPIAPEMARAALRAVKILNTTMPKIGTDDGGSDGGHGWLTGGWS